MARYRVWVETNCVGCEKQDDFEVPDEELAAASDDQEREAIIADYARDVFANLISWGWAALEGE